MKRDSASPAITAMAVVVTSASAAPTNTDQRDVPAVEKDSVASCVLSPSSATKTAAKVVATSFQSMRAGKHTPREAGSFGCGQRSAFAWRIGARPPPMITTVEKVLFLKSIDLFSQIPGEDLAAVALISTEEQRDQGDEIFAEGESGDALYLVIDGKVRVHKADRVIAELGERECFGEMAILDAAPRSATVTAVSDTSLLKITREDFQEIMSEKPEIAQGIIQVLTRRLRDAIR